MIEGLNRRSLYQARKPLAENATAMERISQTQYEILFDDGETSIVSKKYISGEHWAGLEVEHWDDKAKEFIPGKISGNPVMSDYKGGFYPLGSGDLGGGLLRVDYVDVSKLDIRKVDGGSIHMHHSQPMKVENNKKSGITLECNSNRSGVWCQGRVAYYRPDGLVDFLYDEGLTVDDVRAENVRVDEMYLQKRSQVTFEREGVNRRGVISADHGDDTYDILYDDDSKVEAKVLAKDIIKAETYPLINPRVEQRAKVQCNWQGRGQWYPAVVTKGAESDETFSVVFSPGVRIVEEGVDPTMLRKPLPRKQAYTTKVNTLKALASISQRQGKDLESAKYLYTLLVLYITDSVTSWSTTVRETVASLGTIFDNPDAKVNTSDEARQKALESKEYFMNRVAAIEDALNIGDTPGYAQVLVIIADILKEGSHYEGLPAVFDRFKEVISGAKQHHWLKLSYDLSDISVIIKQASAEAVKSACEVGPLTNEYAKEALIFSLKQQTEWTGRDLGYPGATLFDGVVSTISAMNDFWGAGDDDAAKLLGIFKELKLDLSTVKALTNKGVHIFKFLKRAGFGTGLAAVSAVTGLGGGSGGTAGTPKPPAPSPSPSPARWGIGLPKILKIFNSRIPQRPGGSSLSSAAVPSKSSNQVPVPDNKDSSSATHIGKDDDVAASQESESPGSPEELSSKLTELIEELSQFRKSNRMELTLLEIRKLTEDIDLDDSKKKKDVKEGIRLRVDKLIAEHREDLADFSSNFFDTKAMENWREKIGVKFVKSGNKIAWIDKRAENEWLKFVKEQERKLTAQRRGGQLRT